MLRLKLRGWAEDSYHEGSRFMPATCVIGLQWGDEAKGKVVDLLTPKFDIVVRYLGGANAGHTVVVGGRKYNCTIFPAAF